jgi:toxin-antitoxin system PIN domain toxin
VILPDVDVLVCAHRRDARRHHADRAWLEDLINGDAAYAVSDLVLSGFIRIATRPQIMGPPSTREQALSFAARVVVDHTRFMIGPGPRHWPIFIRARRETQARGNLVPDAFLAALALEHGCAWITTDRGFARFKGLRSRHPLA